MKRTTPIAVPEALRHLHKTSAYGKVVSVFPEQGYGFILTREGFEVYFHEHCIVDGNVFEFESGDEVCLQFLARSSGDGPVHATSVRPVAKHHLTDRPGQL